MWFIYDLIIHLYGDAISMASLFNRKARQWVVGRRKIFAKIESEVANSQPTADPSSAQGGFRTSRRPPNVAWFHCASLGEFEQGRPVIEEFRKTHPGWKIVLTFFSPSGYEVRKNYEGADQIFYLPLDTPRNARKFVRLINPSLAIFVKYEFWFRYLDVLYKNKIPVYVISAIFRPDQHFFRWYGSWALKQLKKVTRFFVQDVFSVDLLRAKGIEQVTVSGDTRFDRVATIASQAKSFPLVERFAAGNPVFLAGSTWPADEELFLKLIENAGEKMKFIIAPHEVHRARLEALKERVSSRQLAVGSRQSAVDSRQLAVGSREAEIDDRNTGPEILLFSELTEENASKAKVLIIDGIGYLMHLYQYSTIAYIGGGFGVGIHNILEAATFGKPVIFGPKYGKFREAMELIEEGGAFSINDAQQLTNRTIELLNNPEFLLKTSEISSSYVHKKKGATGIILANI